MEEVGFKLAQGSKSIVVGGYGRVAVLVSSDIGCYAFLCQVHWLVVLLVR